MAQVMVRRRQLNGDPLLIQADLISRDGDRLTVKMPGNIHTQEVNESDTMPVMASSVSGTRAVDPRRPHTAITKAYPASRGAMANMFQREAKAKRRRK